MPQAPAETRPLLRTGENVWCFYKAEEEYYEAIITSVSFDPVEKDFMYGVHYTDYPISWDTTVPIWFLAPSLEAGIEMKGLPLLENASAIQVRESSLECSEDQPVSPSTGPAGVLEGALPPLAIEPVLPLESAVIVYAPISKQNHAEMGQLDAEMSEISIQGGQAGHSLESPVKIAPPQVALDTPISDIHQKLVSKSPGMALLGAKRKFFDTSGRQIGLIPY